MACGRTAGIAFCTLVLLTARASRGWQAAIPAPLDQTDRKGNIRITAVDSFGREIPNVSVKVVSCKNIDSGDEFRNHFHEGLGTNIPYGRYAITLQQDLSHMTIVKQVNLDGPDYSVIAGFNVDASLEDLGPDYITVVGRVNNYILFPKDAGRWVALTAVFTDQRYDAKISAEGYFALLNVLPGQYLLTIRERATILSVSVMSVRGDGQKNIVVEVDRRARPSQID